MGAIRELLQNPIRRAPSRRGELERAVEIATVLFASGFEWLLAALGLQACVSPRCRFVCSFRPQEQCPHHVDMTLPLPDRLRAVLERLGPTFVKAGQMLALRPDYVPLEYAEALRALHDAVPPFPGADAERAVAAELGVPLSGLFAEFEREPFAAASLSQVHRAVLPDGRVVAVKVQRPGIAEQVERDLALLAFLARRVERRRPEALAFRPSDAVAELAEYTRRELDFRREARTAERVRELFAGDERVVVPAVDRERTSARVLTMELVEGLRPAPAGELRAAGLDPERILRAGADAMVQQAREPLRVPGARARATRSPARAGGAAAGPRRSRQTVAGTGLLPLARARRGLSRRCPRCRPPRETALSGVATPPAASEAGGPRRAAPGG